MHTQFKRWSLFTALFATLVLALGVGGSPTAQAQDFLAGNPSCPSGLIEYKIEPGPFEGTYSVPGVGTITVDVTGWKDDGEDLVFDWTSSFGIDYVIVKGGPDANGYPYDEATSGTGLTTPGGYAISHISFCYDMPTYQPLSATKTANGTYDRSVSWQLTKSVSPGSFSGTAGQPVGDALWTVTATKSETFTNYMVTGTITITNPNAIDVSVSVSDTLDDGTVAAVTCPSNIVPANGSLVCDYVASPSANATKNVAVITSSVPEIGGATAEMGVTYVPSGVVHGDDTVTVNDDRYGGFPQTISASQTFTYTEPFTCSSNQADYTNGSDYDIYPNTATLTGASTNLTASAQVDVACMLPPLVPTKTATGTYDRTITWALDKSVTPDVLNGNAGESAGSVTWTVVATKQETPSNYAVSGTISVYNPASIPQTFSVSDMLDDGTVASNLTCDMDTVPAGGTATCTYSAAPFSKAMSNTATVTAAGNLNQTATAEITWTENPIGEEAGTLSDERFDFSQLITGSLTQTFTESFECSSNPNDYTNGSYSYTETNIAILNDNTNLSESATVTVNCTLPPLVPTKDAAGTYDRTVTWDLTKTVTPANHSGYAGDKFSSTWTVIADKTEVVSNIAVTGKISIVNPAAIPQTFTISDYLGDGTVASVDCGSVDTIPAGGTLECTYSAAPETINATMNTVEVTAPGNPTQFDYADIAWNQNLTGVDSGTLSDERFGYSESISADTTETFPETFTCSTDPADYSNLGYYSYTEPNTAILNGAIGEEASADVTVECYLPALQVEKTAAGSYDRTVEWTLTKTVTPANHSGLAGDTFSSIWTVVADKTDSGPHNFAVTGTITITNPAQIAQTFTIQDTLNDGASLEEATKATVDCPTYTIPAGESITCTYIALPDDMTATRNNVVVKAAGNRGQTDRADVNWTENLIGYDSGTLSDERFGYSESISADTTETFPETFTCSTDPTAYGDDGYYSYPVTNTASLNGAIGLTDSAEVVVECHLPALTVEKTAAGSYDRTVEWTLIKTVTPANHSGFAGESFLSAWEVIADKTETLDNYQVTGTITITNPAQIAQTFTVGDVLDDGTAADVTCSTETLEPGESVVCTYTALPADASATLNTATVSAPGNAVVEATATVSFNENLIGYDSGTLSDERFGFSETISADTTETFPETFTCSTDPTAYGDDGYYSYTEPNTAILNGGIDLQDSAEVTVTCYAPVVSKTADEYFNRHWEWAITKDYDGTYNMFAGDSVTHNYIVTVTPTSTDNFWGVKGTITIANPNPTEDMTLTGVTDLAGGIIANVDCDSLIVPAGESITCSYDTGGQDALANPFGALNTATVAFAGIDWIGTAPIDFSMATYTESGAPVITVDDTNLTDEAWSADRAYAEWEYAKVFECPADLSLYVDGEYSFDHLNEAEIVETEDYDTATVNVNCYALDVSKTVETSFTRTWDWEIEKTVTPEQHDLFTGDSADSLYTVTATKAGYVDSDWKVFGTITIINPAPIDAEIASVKDIVRPGTAQIDVDCGVTYPYTLVAGGELTCDYSLDVPDAAATRNTANVRINNTTANGMKKTTQLSSGPVPIDWSDADITEVNAEVNVTDTNGMLWGPVSETTSWTYTRTFECDADEGEHPNTAQVIGDNDVVLDSDDALVDVNCYALDVSKTVEASLVRTWDWDITKGPDGEYSMFIGDPAVTHTYIIDVDKLGFTDSDWVVSGTISVYNPAPMGATINSVSDIVSPDILADVDCSVTFPYTLAADGTLTCTYSADLPDAADRTNTATATLQNYHYDADLNATETGTTDFSFAAAVSFADPVVKEVYAQVNVTDDYGTPEPGDDLVFGPFGDDDSVGYPRNFSCPTDLSLYVDGVYEYTVINTATIDETGDSDSATVTVRCYAPTVDKTADATVTRTWAWEIDKEASESNLMLDPYDVATVNYDVTVSALPAEVWEVTGTITVDNPAPMPMVFMLADVLDDGTLVAITCDQPLDGNQLAIPANTTANCTYTASPADGSATLNTVTVTLNEIDFVDTAEVVFETIEIDECIAVTDDKYGALGTVCAADAPQTFSYSLVFGLKWEADEDVDVLLECGPNHYHNIASFVTNDTGTTGSDEWTVDAYVDCGCTLTRGYWQTHSEFGPAPYDDTWAMLPDGASTPFFLSGQTYYQVMQTPPKGNAYYILAPQYIATQLNLLNGAYAPPQVLAAMAEAEALFEDYTPAQVKSNKAISAEFKSLADLLDRYNNGLYGPPHCS